MSDADERRLADLLRSGLPEGEPPEGLWERSRGRYRRVRARRRAAGVVAAVVAGLAVALAVPRLAPGPPQERLVLDAPAPARPSTPPATPSQSAPSSTPPASTPDDPGPSATPAPPASSTPQPSPSSAGCAQVKLPQDALVRDVGDLDGDGAPDAVALAGGALRFVSADGAAGPPLDAGEEPVSGVGVADADGDARPDLFVRAPGRAGQRVTIARLDGCALTFVANIQGEPYAFDIGEREGALVGMGCVDVDGDGDLELLGLQSRLDGDAYAVQRTVVDLRGARAVNDAIDNVDVAADNARGVELLRSATCGERLLDDVTFG